MHRGAREYRFSGAAAKFVALKHEVKFLSMTCGDAGHHVHAGAALAEIRHGEAEQAQRRLGIAGSEILSYHDTAWPFQIVFDWDGEPQVPTPQANRC